jgi:16S rRNA processing protein RimM
VTGAARLEVGRVGRAHGLKGDVTVTLTSDRRARLDPGSVLYADARELVVVTSRQHSGRWVVRFEGVDDRNAAEALRNVVLSADALDPTEGELWVHELVGARVHDAAGTDLGVVLAVEANPASDLLVLEGDVLIPMTFVVDQTDGVVVVDPPEGLLDVNQRDRRD